MTKPKPKLTMDGLKEAMKPPNNCKVRDFLEALDEDSRGVLESALTIDKREFPASAIQDFLVSSGFPVDDVPGVDAIQSHRVGRKPCRCRS